MVCMVSDKQLNADIFSEICDIQVMQGLFTSTFKFLDKTLSQLQVVVGTI